MMRGMKIDGLGGIFLCVSFVVLKKRRDVGLEEEIETEKRERERKSV